jgi:hypothetical protein
MATKRRGTGCGCLILVVIGLALLIVSGKATEARTAARPAATPTSTAIDAHGFPVGYTQQLLSPMGMSPTQAQCVDDYLEQTQSYATVQAVLLTDNGRRILANNVQAIIAAKCPA